MITQDQIGPKLEPIDHLKDEKKFLESKMEVGSFVLDEPLEKSSSVPPNTMLDPVSLRNSVKKKFHCKINC